VGTEFFRANRQTDRQTDRHDEANSRFRNFANVSKLHAADPLLFKGWYANKILHACIKTDISLPSSKHPDSGPPLSSDSSFFPSFLKHVLMFTNLHTPIPPPHRRLPSGHFLSSLYSCLWLEVLLIFFNKRLTTDYNLQRTDSLIQIKSTSLVDSFFLNKDTKKQLLL
jgi:hypothetical protein